MGQEARAVQHGRKTERPVLRAMAIRRDVVWPKAAGLLSALELMKQTIVATQPAV
jgi:hypothetical protein